ncbi:unnamed protein product, partial [Allacma fusca]
LTFTQKLIPAFSSWTSDYSYLQVSTHIIFPPRIAIRNIHSGSMYVLGYGSHLFVACSFFYMNVNTGLLFALMFS